MCPADENLRRTFVGASPAWLPHCMAAVRAKRQDRQCSNGAQGRWSVGFKAVPSKTPMLQTRESVNHHRAMLQSCPMFDLDFVARVTSPPRECESGGTLTVPTTFPSHIRATLQLILALCVQGCMLEGEMGTEQITFGLLNHRSGAAVAWILNVLQRVFCCDYSTSAPRFDSPRPCYCHCLRQPTLPPPLLPLLLRFNLRLAA